MTIDLGVAVGMLTLMCCCFQEMHGNLTERQEAVLGVTRKMLKVRSYSAFHFFGVGVYHLRSQNTWQRSSSMQLSPSAMQSSSKSGERARTHQQQLPDSVPAHQTLQLLTRLAASFALSERGFP